ncbi:G1 family glutamic endopeptidase [Paenibacillus sp. MMS20-IR301]|uniref:G1 family glutamic endopeptidase n=1 Tax=Paenibacillus sp. MMS20-IR301 TaxID=2895946 RepID=UPI0028E2FFAF|nr:G1 family glutamic endopeptidase [Paenibacillus sp. MMS20-IR301]WNS46373.1 G1 family glutamic endopeptidase [Paenibacillus sp. MMS20-IR301]
MGQVNQLPRSKPCLADKINTGRAASSGFGWTSSNWSGYAISGKKGSFRRISADWIVPYVKPTVKATYSSLWIGIDGFRNSSLIQTGTGHESVNGTVNYYAWWEILPAAETVIPLPVSPGNHMRASIVKLSPGKWCITLRNLTRNWVFRTVQRYNGPQTSAEWIMEAPQVGADIAQLSKISLSRFICCRVNGRSPKLKASDGGIMVKNKTLLAVPSLPGSCGDSFSVRRLYRKSHPAVYSRNPIYTRT